MDALIDLFTSLSGLLSLGIIAFVCLMAAYIARLAIRNMEADSRRAARVGGNRVQKKRGD